MKHIIVIAFLSLVGMQFIQAQDNEDNQINIKVNDSEFTLDIKDNILSVLKDMDLSFDLEKIEDVPNNAKETTGLRFFLYNKGKAKKDISKNKYEDLMVIQSGKGNIRLMVDEDNEPGSVSDLLMLFNGELLEQDEDDARDREDQEREVTGETAEVEEVILHDVATKTMISELSEILSSPNPFQNTLHLEQDNFDECDLRIYDTKGQVLITERISGNSIDLDTSDWAPGIYFCELSENNEYPRVVKKVIKQ